jgi:hypothetical protein
MDVVDETKQRAVLIDEAGFVATLEDVSPLFFARRRKSRRSLGHTAFLLFPFTICSINL